MVEITSKHALFAGMFLLTLIALGTAVYTNVTTPNNAGVLLMIENNPPGEHEHGVNRVTITDPALQNQVDELEALHEKEVNSLIEQDKAIHAKIDERVMPTQNPTSGPTTFRLELSSQHIEVGDAFRITGYDKANTPVFATLLGPLTENVLPLDNQNTRSNGEFELATFIPNSWNPGKYTIIVIIGENNDRKVFTVHP